MLSINRNNIDLTIQVEDDVNPTKLLNRLTLDIDTLLVICTDTFFSRFLQILYEDNNLDDSILDLIEESLKSNKNTIELSFNYKGKLFLGYFIILISEIKSINHPIKGLESFKIGFKELEL